MGLSFSSVSLSCIDCASRINTVEDLEASWKLQSRELILKEEESILKDEFTVFRSQSRGNNLAEPYEFLAKKQLHTYTCSVVETISSSPERKARDLKQRQSSQIQLYRNIEDFGSEVSTPTLMKKSGYKSFSKNCCSVSSTNIVDTIRSKNFN